MICKKCNNENAPIKKTCSVCGAILEGWTLNNVTGKFGYRHADGTFTVISDEIDPAKFFAAGGGQSSSDGSD
jgi:hypothetical protein